MATDTNENITEAFAPPEPGGGGSTKTTWQALSPTKSVSGNAHPGNSVLSNGNVSGLGLGEGSCRSISLTGGGGRDYAELAEGPVLKCVVPPPPTPTPSPSSSRAKEGSLDSGVEGRVNDNSGPQMTTWKSLSPTHSHSPPPPPPLTASPTTVREGLAMQGSGGSGKGSQSSSEGEVGGDRGVTPALMTWKDVSPTSSKAAPRPSLRKRRPESGYYSNEVQSQESREGMDTSLSGSESPRPAGLPPPHAPASPEDGCFNADYFYDEDFSVQFDTNIREPSVDRDLSSLPFPLTGSYARLGWQQDSGGVCGLRPMGDLYSGPYESELSGSRTSMEVSSSERDMMCSSDMLDLGSEPLFTPTPTEALGCPQSGLSVDSLMRENLNRRTPTELGSSRGSGDGRLTVDCCPRKEEYYLSFIGSRLTTSDNSYASQLSSAEEGGGEGSHSVSSAGEEAGEECSDSFHFCHAHDGARLACRYDLDRAALYFRRRAQAARLALSNKLGALPERSIEKSQLSSEHSRSTRSNLSSPEKNVVSPGHSRSTRSSSLGSPNRSPSQNNLSPLLGALQACMEADEFAHSTLSPLLSALQACLDADSSSSDEANVAEARLPRGLTSWRHLKSMRRLGDKMRSGNDAIRSCSLPDLSIEAYVRTTREKCATRLKFLIEGVQSRRHALLLTDLYQRLSSPASPLSPDTIRTVESLLFPGTSDLDDGWEYAPHKAHTLPVCSCRSARGHPPIDLPLNIPPQSFVCAHCEERRGARARRCSKTTSLSPDTVTLWLGTKNAASQFPPNTSDCAIQTSTHLAAKGALDRSQQTSPRDPHRDILSLLQEDGSHASRKIHREHASPPRHSSVMELRQMAAEKNGPRRSLSLSPSRMGKNAFYSHRSLPDLSFLSTPKLAEALSDISLFDPVKIPIFLTPVVEDGRQSSNPSVLSCRCGEEAGRRPRSLGSSGGLSSLGSAHKTHLPRRCASLAADLERLLFRPPHIESALSSTTQASELSTSPKVKCRRAHSEHNLSRRKCSHSHCDCAFSHAVGHAHSPSSSTHKATGSAHKHGGSSHKYHGPAHTGFGSSHSAEDHAHCSCGHSPHSSDHDPGDPGGGGCRDCGGVEGTGGRKLEHYTYEVKPTTTTAAVSNSGMPVNPKPKPRRLSASSPNSNSPGEGALYIVKEEQSPTSPHTHLGGPAGAAAGPLSNRHFPPLGRSTEEDDEEEEGDEGRDESSEELLHLHRRLALDRRPLKSCLRKAPVVRSRSLSNPDSLHALQDGGSPPRKPNRYSIACDGLFPTLVNEDHFNDLDPEEVTQLAAAASALSPQGPPHPGIIPEGGDSHGSQGSGSSGSSVDESGHRSHRKSVSFATQVSFHSPQHAAQNNAQGAPATETKKEEVEEVKITMTLEEFISSDPELRHKLELLQAVVKAANALVEHFAQADTPFDKLRLGSSADCAEVGALLLRMLCPAVAKVTEDGLRPYLTAGLHVFGKIHITPWRVAEMSAELGPYTRAINELVRQLKLAPSLTSNRQRFYAFITGLLNLRLLDFWLGFLSEKTDILEQVYEETSLLRRCHGDLERPFQGMLAALQPLAALPFQLDYALVTSPTRSLSATPLLPREGGEGSGTLTPSRSSPTLARQPFLGEAKGRPASSTRPSPSSESVPASPTGTGWSWLEGAALPRVVSTLTRSVEPARRLFSSEAKKGLRLLGVLSESHPGSRPGTAPNHHHASLGDSHGTRPAMEAGVDGHAQSVGGCCNENSQPSLNSLQVPEKGRVRRTTSGEFRDLLARADSNGGAVPPNTVVDEVTICSEKEEERRRKDGGKTAVPQQLPKPDLLPLDLVEGCRGRGEEKSDSDWKGSTFSQRASVQSPIASFTSLASALLRREPQESQAYRNGATRYEFSASSNSNSTSTSASRDKGHSQGHNSLSRSGSFSLISFFDKLLLPSKSDTANPARVVDPAPAQKLETSSTPRARLQKEGKDGDCEAEKEECCDRRRTGELLEGVEHGATCSCSSEEEDSITLQQGGSEDSQTDEGDEEEEEEDEDDGHSYPDGGSEFSVETSSSGRETGSSSQASATTTTEEYNEKPVLGTDTEELFDLMDSLDLSPLDLEIGSSSSDLFRPSPPPLSTFGKRLKGVGGVARPRVVVCDDNWDDSAPPSAASPGKRGQIDVDRSPSTESLPHTKASRGNYSEARSPIDAAMPWACRRSEVEGENGTGGCLAECVRSPALSMSLDTEVDDLSDLEVTTYANMDVLNANSPNTERMTGDGDVVGIGGDLNKLGSTLSPRHGAWLAAQERALDHFSVPPYQYVVTQVPCDGDDSGCLSYQAGDYLQVLAQLDAQWLYCAAGHSEGRVRISAVTPLHDPDIFTLCHDDFYQ